MRFLVNYIRQCFCKHNFEYEEKEIIERDIYNGDHDIWLKGKQGIKVSITCRKCLYHKSYWKY